MCNLVHDNSSPNKSRKPRRNRSQRLSNRGSPNNHNLNLEEDGPNENLKILQNTDETPKTDPAPF